MYDYGFLVQTATLTNELADQTSDEVASTLTPLFGQLSERISRAVRAYPNGPWEIVSHDITRLERHVVVTFLIRRRSQ